MHSIKWQFILLLYMSNLCQCYSDTKVFNSASDKNCNVIMTIEKKQFSICEPIILSCTYAIVSSTTIYYNARLINEDFDILVMDKNKYPVSMTKTGALEMSKNKRISKSPPPEGILKKAIEEGTIRATPFSTKSIPLNKEDTIELQFLLNRYFDLTREGKYSVQVKALNLSKIILGSPLSVQSPILEFDVVDDHQFSPILPIKITHKKQQ